MSITFENRVRSAAVAGWWMLLIAAGFLTLQWIIYLLVMSARPAWLLAFWGPDITWQVVQQVWFWCLAILKLCLWLMALGILWLTLWAQQMRKWAVKE